LIKADIETEVITNKMKVQYVRDKIGTISYDVEYLLYA